MVYYGMASYYVVEHTTVLYTDSWTLLAVVEPGWGTARWSWEATHTANCYVRAVVSNEGMVDGRTAATNTCLCGQLGPLGAKRRMTLTKHAMRRRTNN